MKKNLLRLGLSFIIVMISSCNEPETVVTNFVHKDGSVTRVIEMRSINDKANERFVVSDLQVPYDSTWVINDSCELDEKEDTIWVRRAVKYFKNADEINLTYLDDSGANRHISRHASFKKSFKWFNTVYRFSEIIDQKLKYDYKISDFLNDDELLYFYSPENLKSEQEASSDSLKYKALSDSVSQKVKFWTTKIMVSAWIDEFSKLVSGKDRGLMVVDSLKSHEEQLVDLITFNEEKFDSLWSDGSLLKDLFGEEESILFRAEADSAIETATEQIWVDFKDYSVKIAMPGIVTETNGFIDSGNVMLWPVKSDFFITEPYEMWAESKTPNRWAWVVSGLFLVFVLIGISVRGLKKG